jgi:hypothetical protein
MGREADINLLQRCFGPQPSSGREAAELGINAYADDRCEMCETRT